MKWLILFSIAFLGPVSCKNDICFTTQLQTCIALKQATMGEDAKQPCKVFGVVKECIQSSEKECKMKEDPNLKDFISVVEDVCKEGSEKNKKFIENFPCFANTLGTSGSCVTSVLKDMTPETAQDPEKLKEMTKTVCKQMDSIVTCFEKKLEDDCTKDVKNFFQDLYNPALKVVKNNCEEILNDDASSSRAVSWLVNLSVLVFVFFWYARR